MKRLFAAALLLAVLASSASAQSWSTYPKVTAYGTPQRAASGYVASSSGRSYRYVYRPTTALYTPPTAVIGWPNYTYNSPRLLPYNFYLGN